MIAQSPLSLLMEVGSRTPLHSAVPRGSQWQDWLCLQVPSSPPNRTSKGTSEDGGCSGRCHIWIYIYIWIYMKESPPCLHNESIRPLGRDSSDHHDLETLAGMGCWCSPRHFLKHGFDSSHAIPPTCLVSFNSKELIPKAATLMLSVLMPRGMEEHLLCGHIASHATNMWDTRVQQFFLRCPQGLSV